MPKYFLTFLVIFISNPGLAASNSENCKKSVEWTFSKLKIPSPLADLGIPPDSFRTTKESQRKFFNENCKDFPSEYTAEDFILRAEMNCLSNCNVEPLFNKCEGFRGGKKVEDLHCGKESIKKDVCDQLCSRRTNKLAAYWAGYKAGADENKCENTSEKADNTHQSSVEK